MNYKRLIPLVVPVLVWALSQIFLAVPSFFYFGLSAGLLIIVLGVRYLAQRSKIKNWSFFIIAPALFFLSFSLYASLISSYYLIQFIFILSFWFIFSYLKNLYYFFIYEAPEREHKLDNLMIGGGFLTLFASASSLYGLPIFLNWPFIEFLLIFIPLVFLLLIQFLAVQKTSFKENASLIFVNILLLSEIALVFSFLPFNFNVLGFLLAILFYFFLLIIRLRFKGELNLHNLKLPIIFSLLIFIITILTARWL